MKRKTCKSCKYLYFYDWYICAKHDTLVFIDNPSIHRCKLFKNKEKNE